MAPSPSPDDLAQVLAAMPVAVAVVVEDQLALVNDAFCQMLGHPREGLLGRHPLSLVDPADLPRVMEMHQARLKGAPIPRQLEFSCLDAQGRARRIEVEVQALEGGRSVVIARAVGERARDRELLTALGALQARVHRERTVAGLLEVAVRGLRDLGFNACVGQHLGGRCVLVADAFQPQANRLLQLMLHAPDHNLAIPLSRMPVTEAALREGRSYFRPDATDSLVRLAVHAGADPAQIEEARRGVPPLNASISPLIMHGEAWGVLMVLAEDLHSNDAAALALFASQVASSMEVAQSIENLEAVHQVALFGAEESPTTLLDRLLPLLASATQSDTAGIFFYAEGNQHLELVGTTLPKALADQFRAVRIPAGPGGTPPPRTSVGLEEVPEELRPAAEAAGLRQMAVVPLTVNGRGAGLLGLGRGIPLRYTDDALRSAEILGAQAALQLERVRLYAEARRRVEHLSSMNELGAAISRNLNLDELLDIAVRQMPRIVDVPNTFVLLLDEKGEGLRLAAVTAHLTDELGKYTPLSEHSAATASVKTLQPVIIRDTDTDERASQTLVNIFGHRAVMAIPIVAQEKALGTLLLGETREPRQFSQEEINRALAIANQLGSAIVNARLVEDLRRSYDELRRTQEELVKRERLAALGELSALVAHEVRNPLGVIFNSTASIRKLPPGSDAAGALLALVEEEAERLNRMVGDLLDFAGPSPARVRPERLELVLSGALEAASRAQPAAHVQLELAVSPQLPEVPVDAQKVRQAVVNLVVNAIQAMPSAGGRVCVRVEPAELRGRPAARLTVEDDGPGMPEEIAARAFEPFFTTRAAGTGLGLSVVKRIADAHGGDVALQSTPGKGSTFSLTFPL